VEPARAQPAPTTAPNDDVAPAASNERLGSVPPLYDIGTVCAVKQRGDPARPLRYAELDLDGCIVRYCISSAASEWRVKTLFTKEPGTIDWLDAFNPGEVFVDVGANVGMYSIYAGTVSRARVFAFEPESQNYAELCRSVFLNEGVRNDILAWCAAIGEKSTEISRLLVRQLNTGDSFHDFGEPSRDYTAAKRFAQGSVAFSLDHLVAIGAIPAPDHVKIDVDGHENKVVTGMRGLLERRAIRSVLLESDPALPHTRATVDWLLAHGWIVNPDQVRFSRDGLRPAEPVMAEVRSGTFTGNIIFGRSADDVAFATRALERFSRAEIEAMTLPS
jgi:FkbM family methyltransferase